MTQSIIGQEFVKKVVPLIDQVKKQILICVFDWRWYENDLSNPAQIFNQSIIRAIRRGVNVQVVTNIPEVVKILKEQGAKVFHPMTTRLVHPKLMILDDEKVIIGSHNYTQSAFTTNFEVSVLLEQPDCIDSLKKFFFNLFGNG